MHLWCQWLRICQIWLQWLRIQGHCYHGNPFQKVFQWLHAKAWNVHQIRVVLFCNLHYSNGYKWLQWLHYSVFIHYCKIHLRRSQLTNSLVSMVTYMSNMVTMVTFIGPWLPWQPIPKSVTMVTCIGNLGYSRCVHGECRLHAQGMQVTMVTCMEIVCYNGYMHRE